MGPEENEAEALACFRDFYVEGESASGAYNVALADIRKWMPRIGMDPDPRGWRPPIEKAVVRAKIREWFRSTSKLDTSAALAVGGYDGATSLP
jgi:hypothetical protein